MASLNQCNFIGNVGKLDARYMPNGDAVTNVSIAINETWKDKAGVKQEKVEWVNIVFYKRLAEVVAEYVKKGMPIFVSGRMATRQWEKDGVTRYATEIVADSMQMLGSNAQNNQADDEEYQPPKDNAPQSDKQQDQSSGTRSFDDFDDDIPFMNPYKFNWRTV